MVALDLLRPTPMRDGGERVLAKIFLRSAPLFGAPPVPAAAWGEQRTRPSKTPAERQAALGIFNRSLYPVPGEIDFLERQRIALRVAQRFRGLSRQGKA